MMLGYEFAHRGRKVRAAEPVRLFARAALSAGEVTGIAVDGKLDDWAGREAYPVGARWQAGDNRAGWTGADDCSARLRLGYDEKNLYVAVDVTDDVLMAEGGQSWQRDGVEVFWDPRGPAGRGAPYGDPCRQVAVPLPAAGDPAKPAVGPRDARPAPKVRAACRRRKGGYTVELAVAIASIAEGFRIAPGKTLRLELLLNDKDDPDEKAPTTCLSISGYTKANYRTWRYPLVTFK